VLALYFYDLGRFLQKVAPTVRCISRKKVAKESSKLSVAALSSPLRYLKLFCQP